MNEFFSDQIGQTIAWFSMTHILIITGFLLSLSLLWIFGPKIKNHKNEKYFRYMLIGLAVLFELNVFENRILNGSIFRIPLCGIALYGLLYAILFRKEKAFNIFYFYAFGTFLTFIFFDTIWGLDRWDGWTYFGAHASIGWFAVYGYRVLGFTPQKKDLYKSMFFLIIYALISGYATFKYGGSDELFLFHAPAEFMNFLLDISQGVYILILSLLAALLFYAMYLPIYLKEKKNSMISFDVNQVDIKETSPVTA